MVDCDVSMINQDFSYVMKCHQQFCLTLIVVHNFFCFFKKNLTFDFEGVCSYRSYQTLSELLSDRPHYPNSDFSHVSKATLETLLTHCIRVYDTSPILVSETESEVE